MINKHIRLPVVEGEGGFKIVCVGGGLLEGMLKKEHRGGGVLRRQSLLLRSEPWRGCNGQGGGGGQEEWVQGHGNSICF